ncbi:hypothetical protein ACFQ46_22400 [Kineococcus sp. GCM10028916]|uniref:hypothetical protein n=1 Tax=Kineococcus sp. GCM10028916 TaxID=3273394 RepID=UPI003631A34E
MDRSEGRPVLVDDQEETEEEEEFPPYWRSDGPSRTRVAVLADSAAMVTALTTWVAASSYELVLAVQLQPSDAGASRDHRYVAPEPVTDVPLLITRTPIRTIAPLVRDLAVDVLVSDARQALPAHVVVSPRRGTVVLQRSNLPGTDGSSWELRSPTHELLAASAPLDAPPSAGEPGGTEFSAVLEHGLRRWLTPSPLRSTPAHLGARTTFPDLDRGAQRSVSLR